KPQPLQPFADIFPRQEIYGAQEELSVGIPLHGGCLKPFDCLVRILWSTLPHHVHFGENELRIGVALLSQNREFLNCSSVVFFMISTLSGLEIRRGGKTCAKQDCENAKREGR